MTPKEELELIQVLKSLELTPTQIVITLMDLSESASKSIGKSLYTAIKSTTNLLPKSNETLTKEKNMNYKTIETLFTYHTPKDIDVKKFEELREGAKYLGKVMIKYGKRKNDTALAIQKLRESLYFAIASIVVPEDDMEGE